MEHFSSHGLWLSAALCFPTDVSGPTRQQWSISNGSKNLIHPPLCFVRLSCKNNEAFFSRQYTKGSNASCESTSRKRWLMMQRIEMISRSNVQLSVHASQSHIHAKQPLPSHIIKSSVMKALTFSTSCHTWTNVQHWQTRRFAARVGQRNNLPIARNFYRHVFWNEPDLAK